MNTLSRRTLFFGGIFVALTALSFVFPPFNSDSVRYSQPGNAFALQWLDYTAQSPDGTFHHGRYFTHTLLRIILQWGEPWLNFITAFLTMAVLFMFCSALKPPHVPREDLSYKKASVLLCTLLLLVNLQGSLTLWFIHAHMVSNFIFMALMLIFFIPYARLAGRSPEASKTQPSLPLLMLWGLLAGSAHEQSVAGVPLLFLLALYLGPKKLPRWYWPGAVAYAVGLAFGLSASASPQRLIEYGNVLEWEFFGQKINWLELGWKRYFYSFVRNYLCDPSAWFLLLPMALGAPLWLSLKRKNAAHLALGESLFYGLLGIFFAGVMVASPFFKGGPHGNSLMFLLLALGILYYHSLKEGLISQKTGARVAVSCFVLLSASALILAVALAKPAANYRKGRALIIEAARSGQSTVTVPDNTTVDLPLPGGGRLSIPYVFEYTSYLLGRYNLQKIVITNGDGGSRTLTRD